MTEVVTINTSSEQITIAPPLSTTVNIDPVNSVSTVFVETSPGSSSVSAAETVTVQQTQQQIVLTSTPATTVSVDPVNSAVTTFVEQKGMTGATGPAGAQGPTGATGATGAQGAGATQVSQDFFTTSTITFDHNLGYKPSILVYALDGTRVFGSESYVSNNRVIVYLNGVTLSGTIKAS